MKKHFFAFTLLVCFAFTCVVHAEPGGGQDGNGGGGVIQDGQYMTFHSAGIYVDPVAKGLESSAALNQLVRHISSSQYLTISARTRLLTVILPAQSRNYYDVRSDKFSKTVKDRLAAEYEKATSAPSDKIVLYAVTDTNSRNTYLLPDFYRLSLTGQMAILFHEAMWLLNPRASYSDIIRAEVTFQAHLEQPTNFTNAQRFVRLVGGVSDEARFTYNWDRSRGNITTDGRIVDGSRSMPLTLAALLGSEIFPSFADAAYFADRDWGSSYEYASTQATKLRLQDHALNLSLAFPNSKFLSFFRDAVMSNRVFLKVEMPENLILLTQSEPNNKGGSAYATTLIHRSNVGLIPGSKDSFSLTSSLTTNLRFRTKKKWKNGGLDTLESDADLQRGTVTGTLFFTQGRN